MKSNMELLIEKLSKEELDELIKKAQKEKAKRKNIHKVYYFQATATAEISVQADNYQEAEEKLHEWMNNHYDEDILKISDGFDFKGYEVKEENTVNLPPIIK